MALKNIQVFEDWQLRAERGRALDRRRWWTGITIALVCGILMWVIGVLPTLQKGTAWNLGNVLIGPLLVISGMLETTRRKYQHGWLLLATAYLVLASAAVLGTPALQREVFPGLHYPNIFVIVASIGLLAIGWSLLAKDLLREWAKRRLWLFAPEWWIPRVVLGIVGGLVIVWELSLAAYFSDSPATFGFNWALILRYSVYILGIRAVGEELIYRRLIFHYLYRRRQIGFWISAAIALSFNMLIYLAIMPENLSPSTLSLYILGPALMAITNSVLYAKDGTILSSVISNILFQLVFLRWF